MLKLNRFIVVLSACKGECINTDNRYMDELRASIDGFLLQYDRVEGVYKGTAESALAVQCRDFRDVGYLLELANKYEQESIMLVDSRNQAYLLYCKGSRLESLGYMLSKAYNPTDKEHPDSYTLHDGTMHFTSWGI